MSNDKDNVKLSLQIPTERLDQINSVLDKLSQVMQLVESNPRLFGGTPAPVPEIGKSIFISYRRADSAYITGRIYDRLEREFGPNSIFRDVDDILAGRNFTQQLEMELARCDLMLVIIGRDWLDIKNHGSDERRLDNPNDIVRLEVETALDRRIPVIPVLVRDANIPARGDLPLTLKPINALAGLQVRPDPVFEDDVRRLVQQIKITLELEN